MSTLVVEEQDVPSKNNEHALVQLQSREQVDLLNAIDGLRHENIGVDLNLPQVVVCGDQSSGKSSVLEAIAQIQFPIGTETITRFPIEFVLRRSSKVSIIVKLRAAAHRPVERRVHIESFRPSVAELEAHHFPDVVQEALQYLEEFEPDCNIWDDLLSAEISGPHQPHLTLIDLPGLVHYTDKDSDRDARKTQEITLAYCTNPRSVVLAVINATYDLSVQKVMSLVKGTGSVKERTLAVITKSDRLEKGSSEQGRVMKLVKDLPLSLGLGCHLLRNLSHDAPDRSVETRGNIENAFFQEAPWSSLSDQIVGIRALRQKLSKSLFDCITGDLPSLRNDMQGKLEDCNRGIARLGAYRETAVQQREFLVQVVSHLQRLVQSALDGATPKSEFADFFDGHPQKRLRDVITQNSVAFGAEMRGEGKQFHLYSQADNATLLPRIRKLELDETINFHPPYALNNSSRPGPRHVELISYCKALSKHMSETQGRNLPGTISENIVHDVFRQQSLFWRGIIFTYVERCFKAAMDFMHMAVMHVTGLHTGNKLMDRYIIPAFTSKNDKLDEKVSELLWPFTESHPATNNPRYEAAVRHDARYGSLSASWVEKVREQLTFDNLIPAAEAIERADAYYEIALDTLIDNVATLAIERCLLSDLARLIIPEKVSTLNEEELSQIAGEPEDAQRRRERLTKQIVALKSLIQACKRYAPTTQKTGHLNDGIAPPSARINGAQAGEAPKIMGFGNSSPNFNFNSSTKNSASIFGSLDQSSTKGKKIVSPDFTTFGKLAIKEHKSTAGCEPLFGHQGWVDEHGDKLCYHSLQVHDDYKNSSFEELRLNDYVNARYYR